MKVGVIGSGAIGPDLAYGFVSALVNDENACVYLHDIKESALQAGVSRIQKYVKKGLVRGKLSAKQAAAIEKKLIPTLQIGDLKDCDYVLEAATENLDIKRVILGQLESIVSPKCLIGFATSGLPRAHIARDAQYPDRCFVNHPFYPAWRSPPIEIVLSNDEHLGAQMIKTVELLGKVPIITADVECFAADDIFCNYCSEAARLAQEGVASPAQIDAIVHKAIGGGGPLNVLDLTRGNILTAKCQRLMRDAPTGGKWFEPPTILEERGNQLWHETRSKPEPYSEATKKIVLDRILAVLLSRTLFVLEKQVCDATSLDWLTRMALGFRKGLLDLAHELGEQRIYELCTQYGHQDEGFYIPESVKPGAQLAPFQQNVTVSTTDGIAEVMIYRPEVKNALNSRTIRELDAAFDKLASDQNVKGIILTAFDGAMVGADIGDLAQMKTEEEAEQTCYAGQALLNKIEQLDKPVVAVLNGPVMGGGAEISMACHARSIGSKLILSQPEVNLGLIPGYGGSQRLPRIIGLEKSLEMLRTGKPINAKTAADWGWGTLHANPIDGARTLLQQHFDTNNDVSIKALDPSPMSLPEQLPNTSIGYHSRAIDSILMDVITRGLSQNLYDGLKIEAQGVGRSVVTVDFDIGIKNFFQNGPRVPAEFLHE